MAQIRKIGQWLWLNKERIVLAVMVVFLCWRVYQVVYPPPPPKEKDLRAPRNTLDGVDAQNLPPAPNLPPPPNLPGNYLDLYKKNPFWYYSGRESSGGNEVTPESLGIHLLDIKQVSGKWRAQLRTRSTTKWYYEGEQFEEFELQKINPEDKTVVVYAVRYGKRLTLSP